MKFEVVDPIPFSVSDAFTLLRDEMRSLVPYMADTAKKASWKTVEQLQEEGLISDYHGEIIGRTGSYTFN